VFIWKWPDTFIFRKLKRKWWLKVEFYTIIKKIIPLKEVSLEELRKVFPDFVVPQSYYILDKKPELLNYLKSKEY